MAEDPARVRPGTQVGVVTGAEFSVNGLQKASNDHDWAEHHDDHVFTDMERAFAAPTAHNRAPAPLEPPLRARRAAARVPDLIRSLAAPARCSASQAKISPPLVSSACPVIAEDRSEAK